MKTRHGKSSPKWDESTSDGPLNRITITLDLPPSTNHLYIRRRGGGVALSEVARQYHEHAKRVLSARAVDLSLFPAGDQSTVYGVEVVCHMKQLEYPDWFSIYDRDHHYMKDSKDGLHKRGDIKHRKGERKAKNRYKKVDIDNRVKFAQDCVIRGLGIPDDSQVFEGTQRKIQTEGDERVEVTVYTADHARFFPGGLNAEDSRDDT